MHLLNENIKQRFILFSTLISHIKDTACKNDENKFYTCDSFFSHFESKISNLKICIFLYICFMYVLYLKEKVILWSSFVFRTIIFVNIHYLN